MPQYLGPWHESVSYGLSTFVEENSYWRSLCHAWSAHPVLEFQQRILGVMPVEPGFTRIRLQPNRCGLTHAQGSVCTPFGLIIVAWRVTGATFTLEVAGPKNIPGQVILPDGSTQEFAGGQASYKVALP
jgi:hypothetical protein